MYKLALTLTLMLSGCGVITLNPAVTGVPDKTSQSVEEPVRNIRAVGTGKTVEDAKNDAFKRAIEYVVGSVVISTQESKNDKLVRDDILKHSAGYVDEYTIYSTSRFNDGWMVEMDVRIKGSKIANRLMGRKDDTTTLQGDRMATQYSTYMQDRASGDRMIKEVVGNFPKNAFIVTGKEVEFKLRTDRTPILVVSYNLKWDYKYVTALREMLSVLQDGRNDSIQQERFHIQSKPPENMFIGRTDSYYFNDNVRGRMIKEYLSPGVTVRASILDDNGKILFAACSVTQWMADGPNITNPSRYTTSDEDNRTLEIPIPTVLSRNDGLRLVSRIKLEAVSQDQCRKTIMDMALRR